MAENQSIVLDYKDIAAWAVKEKGIHDGIWGIYARFGLTVANTEVDFEGKVAGRPTVISPLIEIGIQPYKQVNDLSVDAAVVNPAVRQRAGGRRATKKAKKK